MASEQNETKVQANEGSKKVVEELPLQSSPYVKYNDLEDYKRQGYGTDGHFPVVDNERGGGATDAPTLSGANLSEPLVRAVDAANRKGAL